MFFNSTFEEEELIKEKNVVYEEIKMYEDTPDDIVHDLLSKAIYENHPLGYPILGTEETLATFKGDTLKDYMHNMYTPDKLLFQLLVILSESFIKEVEKLFGSYEGGQRKTDEEKPIFHMNQSCYEKRYRASPSMYWFDGLASRS